MINEDLTMKWVWAVALLVATLGAACTKPNPLSCVDGLCSDPAFPVCDADGSLDGNPGVCIAVDCSPSELLMCRGDDEVRCNTTGDNVSVVQCQLGCIEATGGCITCSSDEQCDDPTPVCDVTAGSCRGCSIDDECPSRVCDVDTGACIADSAVVYASSDGSASGPCSQATPCSLSQATSTAAANPLRSIVRMLPGLYTTPVAVTGATVTFVGTGATHQLNSGSEQFDIEGGANVTIRGLALDLGRQIRCGDGSATRSTLLVRDLTMDATSGDSGGMIFVECNATLQNVNYIGNGATSSGSRISVVTGTKLVVDHALFRNVGAVFMSISVQGQRLDLKITDSVFDNASFFFFPAANAQARLLFAFNTVRVSGTDSGALSCTSGAAFTTIIENNVIVRGPGAGQNAIDGCAANNNILFPQTIAIAGTNFVTDPLLVDPANHDFHLRLGSPAIDAANPTTGLDSASDFDGTPRPQGARSDIGAFEFVP